MMDWVLSIKSPEDSSADLFNDLMVDTFDSKAKTGGLGYMAVALANAGYERGGLNNAIDSLIDKDDKSIDANLEAMREFYGPKKLEEMTPSEFYTNYKKFASGLTF